jgi:hypothetical protein
MSDSIAQTTLTAAIAAGFDRLSPRDVMLCILEGAQGSGTVDSISVAGPPTAIPPAIANIVVDVNGRQWQYYAGGWN